LGNEEDSTSEDEDNFEVEASKTLKVGTATNGDLDDDVNPFGKKKKKKKRKKLETGLLREILKFKV
jgi:hypothetical protein